MSKQEKTAEELAREVRALQRRIEKSEAADKQCRESLETLQGKETLYRNLLEAAQEMIFVIGRDDNVHYVNAFAARSLGLPLEEVIGRPRRELFPPHIAERQEKILKAIFETGEPAYIEDWTTFQGVEVWIGTRVTPLRDEKGNVTSIMGISRDITERMKAEEKLRTSEDRFRAMLESTSDWIWEVDENARYTYASPKIKDFLGYEPEEIIGKTPFDLMPPEEARRVLQEFGIIAKNRLPIIRLENLNLHKDGRLVVLETSGVPIIDRDGQLNGYRGIDRDVTDRKKAEEVLHLTRFTVDTVSDAVYWIDSKARIVDVNETACNMLGYGREEFLNLTVLDLNPNLTAERWAALWETLRDQGKITMETAHRAKDGRVIPVEIIAHYLSFGGRELDCAFARDITDRKEAEEYLRESENKFRVLAEKSPNMIFILQGSRIVYANERSEQVTGYAREEAYQPGFNYLALLVPEHVGRAQEHMLKLLQGREMPPSEYSLITKEGRRIATIITSKLIEYGNGPALLGIVTDITERKEMEKALLDSEKRLRMHAQELEESNNALKVLLKQRENDKKELEENILANLKQLVLPYIAKLKTNRQMSDDLVYLNIIESNLREIVSPFSLSLSSNYLGFTPREMLIADLVKDGKQDKDISEILNISVDTVKVHRKNIRKKLGIAGTGTNLRVHLLSLSTR